MWTTAAARETELPGRNSNFGDLEEREIRGHRANYYIDSKSLLLESMIWTKYNLESMLSMLLRIRNEVFGAYIIAAK